MRVRIIGSCGSGKSYIARKLSIKYRIPFIETDNLVWDRKEANKRYPEDVRDAKLKDIVNKAEWIIEGVHHKWGQESFTEADLIFIIQPHALVRDYRVLRRFVRTRLGWEQANYKQTLRNLYEMLVVWNRKFDKELMQEILELSSRCQGICVVVRSNREIETAIERYLKQQA